MRLRSIAFALLVLVAGGPAWAAGAPDVLVTIKPIHSLVAAVMEGVARPALLISGAQSEHSYVLKPSDANKIAAAQIIFWVGPELETYLKTPLNNLAPNAKTVALENAKGVYRLAARRAGLWTAPSQKATNGNINPHVWLDPTNAIAIVHTVAATLSATDPAHARKYAANARAETARLEALDARLVRKLAPVRHIPFIVYHDAYPYFVAHYHLDAIGAVTVEPNRPVGPRRIVTLRTAIKNGKAVCIFREPQFPPALVQTLAAGTKVRTGVLDPLGADLAPGPNLYPTLLTHMADALVTCLKGTHR